jgi:hypothetical protein
VLTVSVASVNSYTTKSDNANIAVATTLTGAITVKQVNNDALETDAPGIVLGVYRQLKVVLAVASIGSTTVTLSRNSGDGSCQFASDAAGTGLATTLAVTISAGNTETTALFVKCATAHGTGAKIIGTRTGSSVNQYNPFTAGTAMLVFTMTFAPTTVPKRSSGTTTVTITLSSGTWSSTTDRIKIVGASDTNCAGATICGHVVVSGGNAGPPGVRTAGFTCATAVKDGKICYSNDAGTR